MHWIIASMHFETWCGNVGGIPNQIIKGNLRLAQQNMWVKDNQIIKYVERTPQMHIEREIQ